VSADLLDRSDCTLPSSPIHSTPWLYGGMGRRQRAEREGEGGWKGREGRIEGREGTCV